MEKLKDVNEVWASLIEDLLSCEDCSLTKDRTGIGTISKFGHHFTLDISKYFPLITLKNVHWKSVIEELIFFVKGETNVKYLQERGVTIWDEWADKNGNLGPIYGYQWRNWSGTDQLQKLVKSLITDPFSRRHIVSAWNVSDIPKMALPPCHVLFQVNIDNKKRLSLQVYQRSADVFLGLPFNIASYSALAYLLCKLTFDKYTPHLVHFALGDAHIYSNHIEQCKEVIKRYKQGNTPLLPMLDVDYYAGNLNDVNSNHFKLLNYNPLPTIKAPIAI